MTSDTTAPSSADTDGPAAPPVAERRPIVREHHGDRFSDPYEWLRDTEDPDVLAHLTAENAWAERRTAGLQGLRDAIFDEIATRTQQTDLSVPVREGDFWYYRRTVEGLQYGIHARVPVEPGVDDPPDLSSAGPDGLPGEQVLLDANEVAGDSGFFSLGAYEVSPDGTTLAYAVDLTGDERFTLRLRDLTPLADGNPVHDLPDEVLGVFYGAAWAADNATVFYTRVDEAWRPYQVLRHVRGTGSGDDELVYTEDDEKFWVSADLARDGRFVQIESGSKDTSEVRLVDALLPASEPVVVRPRRTGVEYAVEPDGDRLLIVHNDGAPNFALSWAGLTDADDMADWRPVLPPDPAVRVVSVDAFTDFAMVYSRVDGTTRLTLLPRDPDSPSGFGGPRGLSGFDEPVFTVEPGENPERGTGSYRLEYSSLVTPSTVYDYRVADDELVLRKRTPVLGGVDLDDYVQYRDWAAASDGTRIPLSIVARRDVLPEGSGKDAADGGRRHPCLLYGYGAYEVSMDPTFTISRLSLLDRGVVYVIAHVRGGGELGRPWYEHGRLLEKRNTFTDYVAAAQRVVEAGWTSPQQLVAYGGSAGGLLMGAVTNLAPDAFAGVCAVVPFVDPLTSVLDPSLPLTVTEWEEWGDPLHDADVYAYMKGYSPYEQLPADVSGYPRILAITSLNDTRVLYVEPAKWVAALRHAGAEDVAMRIEMEAGHGGRSGRYDAWRELAFMLAWQLEAMGVDTAS